MTAIPPGSANEDQLQLEIKSKAGMLIPCMGVHVNCESLDDACHT